MPFLPFLPFIPEEKEGGLYTSWLEGGVGMDRSRRLILTSSSSKSWCASFPEVLTCGCCLLSCCALYCWTMAAILSGSVSTCMSYAFMMSTVTPRSHSFARACVR